MCIYVYYIMRILRSHHSLALTKYKINFFLTDPKEKRIDRIKKDRWKLDLISPKKIDFRSIQQKIAITSDDSSAGGSGTPRNSREPGGPNPPVAELYRMTPSIPIWLLHSKPPHRALAST